MTSFWNHIGRTALVLSLTAAPLAAQVDRLPPLADVLQQPAVPQPPALPPTVQPAPLPAPPRQVPAPTRAWQPAPLPAVPQQVPAAPFAWQPAPPPLPAPEAPLPLPAQPDQAAPPPPAQPPPTPRPGQAPRPPEPSTRTPAPDAAPPMPPTPRAYGQPVNIRIDLAISDEGGTAAPLKKTVSMTVGDREFGQIRSEAFVTGGGNVPLNVDARPMLTTDGKIRVQMTLNYNLTYAAGRPAPKEDVVNALKTEIREQLAFILENGKPLVVSQSADPIGERRVTVEVKATVLR